MNTSSKKEPNKTKQIKVEKETTIQAYGEFWDAFIFLKKMQDGKNPSWSKFKLSALTMACFSIEAFANHIGKSLHIDWEKVGAWESTTEKLKKFIKTYQIDLNPGHFPFQTITQIMDWRNHVAHARTEIIKTDYVSNIENYNQIFEEIEKTEWQKFYFEADLNIIEKNCKDVMEKIHRATLKNISWFLGGARQSASAKN